MPTKLLPLEEVKPVSEMFKKTLDALHGAIFGQEELQKMLLVAILARGHVLLEGLPGLGKTALVNTIAQLMDISFKRVQFTPDLMPGDILGTHILQESESGRREMVFQPGPIFTNILLGDEINRASPKTQSAMLEAMQEGRITTMGETRELPRPFFVLATQNPIELEGTYPLPEAQVDRFLFKLLVSSPDTWVLEKIVKERHRGAVPTLKPILDRIQLAKAFDMIDMIQIPDAVAWFIAKVVMNSSPEARLPGVSEFIRYGASSRAAIAMAESSRALALIEGRPSVGFADVEAVAPWTLHHRIVPDYKAKAERISTLELARRILKGTTPVSESLPKGVELVKEQ